MLALTTAANLNNNHHENMASLTGLPPELRAIVYNYLLEDGLASEKRIVYCQDDDQYNDLDFLSVNQQPEHQDFADVQHKGEPIGWTRSAMQFARNHQTRITSLVDVRYTYGPDVLKRAVHHADIDDLLALATTCHRIRTEVLPIAWSNADISIYTPEDRYKDDIFHIFDRCLSGGTCAMIRNIRIDVGTSYWSASDVSETANFIMKRLPCLQDLHVSVARENIKAAPPEFDHGLRALTCLPCKIMVEIVSYIHPSTISQEPFSPMIVILSGNGTRYKLKCPEEWEQVISLNDMFFFESMRRDKQFARALRAQNEERHIDGSLLEDTLGSRSRMAGWSILASDTVSKERWEVRREGHWRNDWMVKEGVEYTTKGKREHSLGPFYDKMKASLLSEGKLQDNMG